MENSREASKEGSVTVFFLFSPWTWWITAHIPNTFLVRQLFPQPHIYQRYKYFARRYKILQDSFRRRICFCC